MKKIISLGGSLVELDKVKGVSINEDGYYDSKLESNYIKIELLNRKEYILNPETLDWELHDLNDEILIEFPDSDSVAEKYLQIKEVWEEAINK